MLMKNARYAFVGVILSIVLSLSCAGQTNSSSVTLVNEGGDAYKLGEKGLVSCRSGDWDKGFRSLKEAYDKRPEALSAEMIYFLDECYGWGNGVLKNGAKAFGLYQKAFLKGYNHAAIDIAICYINGDAGEKNERKALEWLDRVIDKEEAEVAYLRAQILLGRVPPSGEESEQDVQKGIASLRKACLKGQPDSFSLLATLLSKERRQAVIGKKLNEETRSRLHLHLMEERRRLAESMLIGYEAGMLRLGMAFAGEAFVRHRRDPNWIENDKDSLVVSQCAIYFIYLSKDDQFEAVRLYWLGILCSSMGDRKYGAALCLAAHKKGVSFADEEFELAKQELRLSEEEIKEIELLANEIYKEKRYESDLFDQLCDPRIMNFISKGEGIDAKVLQEAKGKRMLGQRLPKTLTVRSVRSERYAVFSADNNIK